jgi:hypothetical protein
MRNFKNRNSMLVSYHHGLLIVYWSNIIIVPSNQLLEWEQRTTHFITYLMFLAVVIADHQCRDVQWADEREANLLLVKSTSRILFVKLNDRKLLKKKLLCAKARSVVICRRAGPCSAQKWAANFIVDERVNDFFFYQNLNLNFIILGQKNYLDNLFITQPNSYDFLHGDSVSYTE